MRRSIESLFTLYKVPRHTITKVGTHLHVIKDVQGDVEVLLIFHLVRMYVFEVRIRDDSVEK